MKSRLSALLTALFALALIMGPGPGLHLINPDPADPNAIRTFLGLPIVYAWGLLWFAVMIGVLLVAYFKIWSLEDTED